MIVYFTDRNLEIKAQASTNLPGGFRLYDDKLTESIESGVNTFEFKVSYNDKTRAELESAIQVGSFVLRSGGRTDEHSNVYSSLYQVIETEFDTKDYSLSVYAEDAGLELLNKVCEQVTFTEQTLSQMLSATIPSDWSVNLIGTPSGTQTYAFDGENTATERVNSIVGLFDCEAYYSFVIERMSVTAKVLNVIPRRGNQDATVQLRLNKDIDRIATKKTIADIATAFKVTGGTPEGSDVPVNLIGYSYHVIDGDEFATDYWYKQNVDSTVVDEGKVRNISACRRWASAIDQDGLIVKSYEFDDTDKAMVAGQAKGQLKTDSQVGIEYTVDFVNLPEDTQIGDRVNIIDDDGGLYLEARLLTIETSVADCTQTATIGEYVLKSSGISQKVLDIAEKIQKESAQINNLYQVKASNDDLNQTGSDFESKLNAEIAERKSESLTNVEGYNLVNVDSDGLVMTGTQGSEASMEMSATEIVLKKDGYAAATIKSDDSLGSIIDADAADISTLKMTNVNGQGSLGWVAQENNHLTLKEI